jgi:hypothetical protein
VSDLRSPSRLEILRGLERYLLREVDRVRQWIAVEEDRERRAAHTPPPRPDWLVQLELTGGRPLAVHVGDCTHRGAAKGRPITRDEALRLLADQVEACGMCRPDRSGTTMGPWPDRP